MPDDEFQRGAADEEPGRLAGAAMPRVPPLALEERVMTSLVSRGLLAPRAARSGRRRAGLLAAAVAIFAAGLGVGWIARAPSPSTGEEPRWALLLYDDPDAKGVTTAPLDDVEAHRQWARRLAADGHFITGEKLAAGVVAVLRTPQPGESPPARDGEQLAGFFVISARDSSDATAIARSSPHARHGGRVVVRAIEPT